MSGPDELARFLPAAELAWADEWGAAADVAKVLHDYAEELVARGVPPEVAKAKVFAAAARIFAESEGPKGEES